MPLKKFDLEQCRSFIFDSKSYYQNNEPTNQKIVHWKFMCFDAHPSYHLYIHNPKTNRNAGRAVLNTRTLNMKGRHWVVTQVTDLLTIKTHASLITFIELIKNFNLLNTNAVFHTSNEKSEKIYSQFFKFKKILELSAFAFPIRPQKVIPILRRYTILEKFIGVYSLLLNALTSFIKMINPVSLVKSKPSDNITNILHEFSKREVSLSRSEAFLRWRYFDSPYTYQLYTIKFRKNPIGILITRSTTFNECRFFLVMDFLTSEQIKWWKNLCLQFAVISEAIVQNADSIFGLLNKKNSNSSAFFKLPFFWVNDNILPHGSPIFQSSTSPSLSTKELGSMYFSLGDLDYF
jgi:hypothetical protein